MWFDPSYARLNAKLSNIFPAKLFSPNAAPFDARRSPFSGTARVSQALDLSEPIPCIRPQTREIELPVRDPHRCGCYFLLPLIGLGVVKHFAEVDKNLIPSGFANSG